MLLGAIQRFASRVGGALIGVTLFPASKIIEAGLTSIALAVYLPIFFAVVGVGHQWSILGNSWSDILATIGLLMLANPLIFLMNGLENIANIIVAPLKGISRGIQLGFTFMLRELSPFTRTIDNSAEDSYSAIKDYLTMIFEATSKHAQQRNIANAVNIFNTKKAPIKVPRMSPEPESREPILQKEEILAMKKEPSLKRILDAYVVALAKIMDDSEDIICSVSHSSYEEETDKVLLIKQYQDHTQDSPAARKMWITIPESIIVLDREAFEALCKAGSKNPINRENLGKPALTHTNLDPIIQLMFTSNVESHIDKAGKEHKTTRYTWHKLEVVYTVDGKKIINCDVVQMLAKTLRQQLVKLEAGRRPVSSEGCFRLCL